MKTGGISKAGKISEKKQGDKMITRQKTKLLK